MRKELEILHNSIIRPLINDDDLTGEDLLEIGKAFIFAADNKFGLEKKEKLDNEFCKCGHKRKRHTVTYSINHTDGLCKDCDCKYFRIA
jgi:hypothetical protein